MIGAALAHYPTEQRVSSICNPSTDSDVENNTEP